MIEAGFLEAARAVAALRGDAGPIEVLDVGANPLEEPSYKGLLDIGLCRVTGFEPHPEALAKLVEAKGPNETYLPYALGDGSEGTLYVTAASGFTSLFRPIRPVARMLGWSRWMASLASLPVATRRLDTITELAPVDFLKVDVQGSELAILRNGAAKLVGAVAIQTEVRFLPIYKGEPAFGDLDRELRRQGFAFHDFFVQNHKPFASPNSRRLAVATARQLVDADAIYVRDLSHPSRLTDDQLFKLSTLALGAFGRPGLAVYCLDQLLLRGRITQGDVDRVFALFPVGTLRGRKQARKANVQAPEVSQPQDISTRRGPSKVLFSAVRNEGPFLLEWIAYHRAIGFERIILFTNNSDDGTTELLEALQDANVLELHLHQPPEGTGAQSNAARIANEQGLLVSGDWVTWLDADEFLNIHCGDGQVDDLIAAIGTSEGMLIPWRVFGDGGQTRFSGRFLSQDYRWAASDTMPFRNEIKSFFRFGEAVSGLALTGINRPRLNGRVQDRPDLFLFANGRPLNTADRRTRLFYAGEDFVESCHPGAGGEGWDLAQINHYLVRTPEMFLKKKYRGNGWKVGEEAANDRRHTRSFYRRMNRNDVEDVTILRHLPALRRTMAELTSYPGVIKAQAKVAELHEKWLTEHAIEIQDFMNSLRGEKVPA